MISVIETNFNLHANMVPELIDGMHVHKLSNLTFVDSGLSCDTFNILHITNGSDLQKGEIEQGINHYRNQNLDFCIWINDENLTSKVSSYFNDLGISVQGEEIGMTLDLTKYENKSHPLHSNIQQVTSAELLDSYSSVLARNWTPADQNVITYYQQTKASFLDSANGIILLIHHFDGVPVSTVELFPTDKKTIGIYGLATLESYRGKGIGSSMMSYILNTAKSLGYETAILQATEDGIGIYEKMGFVRHTKYYEFALKV